MRGIPTMHPDVELLVFFSCWKSAGEGGVRRGNRQQSDKMAFGTPIPTEQEGGRCLIRSANVDCAISDARYRSGSHVAFSSPLHIINIIDQISTARYCMMLVRYRGVCEPSKFSRTVRPVKWVRSSLTEDHPRERTSRQNETQLEPMY